MNFLSQLFGGQPGVTTGIPQGMGAAEASKLYSSAQSPFAGPGGMAGPMPGQGLDINAFAAEQNGKPGVNTLPGQPQYTGARGFAQNLGAAMQKQQGSSYAQPQELPQMPMGGGMRNQAFIAELLNSIGGGGNYLGRLGGSF